MVIDGDLMVIGGDLHSGKLSHDELENITMLFS